MIQDILPHYNNHEYFSTLVAREMLPNITIPDPRLK